MTDTKHTPGNAAALHDEANDIWWVDCGPFGVCDMYHRNSIDPSKIWRKHDAEANAKRVALTWNCHDELLEVVGGLMHLQTEAGDAPDDDTLYWMRRANEIRLKAKGEAP